MITAYIALGSNLQNPEHQLRRAVTALTALPDSQLQQVSSAYRSAAIGPGQQPEYLNAVARLKTTLPPEDLLDALQQQELEQGRVRSTHWGARTLDLDILLYGNEVIATERLSVPHRSLKQRNFVLYPLQQVCPDNFVLPDGTDLDTLVRDCPLGNLTRTGLQLHNN